MQAPQRDHQVKGTIVKGISVLRTIGKEVASYGFWRIFDPMAGNVEAADLRLEQEELEFVKQVGLAAAHIEYGGIFPEAVGGDQLFGNTFPAAILPVPTVAETAVTVTVVELVFLCLLYAVDLVVHHPGRVVAIGLFVQRSEEVQQPSHRPTPLWRWQLMATRLDQAGPLRCGLHLQR